MGAREEEGHGVRVAHARSRTSQRREGDGPQAAISRNDLGDSPSDEDRAGEVGAIIPGDIVAEGEMPIFDFTCRSWGNEFEALVRKAAPKCPKCESEDLERMLSLPVVRSEGTKA